MAARQHVLALARRAGLEPQLRAVQRAALGRSGRRNLRDDEHLRVLMAVMLRRDANYVDIGANVGAMLAQAVHFAPAGRHLAFEPLPELCERLRERHPEADVRQVALSNAAGEATFTRVPDAPSQSGFSRPDRAGTETFTVRTARLDDELPDGYVPHFVKIDVEGAEQQVLEGAIGTLRTHRPVVALEHGSAASIYGTTPADIHDLLVGEAGLAIFDMDGEGPLDRAAFEATVDPAGPRWNFFARPA